MDRADMAALGSKLQRNVMALDVRNLRKSFASLARSIGMPIGFAYGSSGDLVKGDAIEIDGSGSIRKVSPPLHHYCRQSK